MTMKSKKAKVIKKTIYISASGLSETTIDNLIRKEAFVHQGLFGHSWSRKLKAAMLKKAASLRTRDEIIAMIGNLARTSIPGL